MSRMSLSLALSALLLSVLLVGCGPELKVSAPALHFLPDTETATFDVYNNGTGSIRFYMTPPVKRDWLTIESIVDADGNVADIDGNAYLDDMGAITTANEKYTVTVSVDQEGDLAKSADEFYTGVITVSAIVNDAGGAALPSVTVTITTEPDYITQTFAAGDFQGSNTTYAFVPDGSINFYEAQLMGTAGAVNEYPTDPTGAEVLPASDFLGTALAEKSISVDVLVDEVIPFFGESYDLFYVGAAGYVAFADPLAEAAAKQGSIIDDHFAIPRITALSQVDGSAGGEVSVIQTSDRVAVTYDQVPSAAAEATKQGTENSFQIEMLFNGEVHLTYLDVDMSTDGMMGLSVGGGLPLDPDGNPSWTEETESNVVGPGANLPEYNTEYQKATLN